MSGPYDVGQAPRSERPEEKRSPRRTSSSTEKKTDKFSSNFFQQCRATVSPYLPISDLATKYLTAAEGDNQDTPFNYDNIFDTESRFGEKNPGKSTREVGDGASISSIEHLSSRSFFSNASSAVLSTIDRYYPKNNTPKQESNPFLDPDDHESVASDSSETLRTTFSDADGYGGPSYFNYSDDEYSDDEYFDAQNAPESPHERNVISSNQIELTIGDGDNSLSVEKLGIQDDQPPTTEEILSPEESGRTTPEDPSSPKE